MFIISPASPAEDSKTLTRLGRDMREVISTVYELADLGVTVIPIKSQTGPINPTLGKLLWSCQC